MTIPLLRDDPHPQAPREELARPVTPQTKLASIEPVAPPQPAPKRGRPSVPLATQLLALESPKVALVGTAALGGETRSAAGSIGRGARPTRTRLGRARR